MTSSATRPLRLRSTAGLSGGSIPTTGTLKRSRSLSSAAEEAVLQATTSNRAPASIRESPMASERSAISSGGRSP